MASGGLLQGGNWKPAAIGAIGTVVLGGVAFASGLLGGGDPDDGVVSATATPRVGLILTEEPAPTATPAPIDEPPTETAEPQIAQAAPTQQVAQVPPTETPQPPSATPTAMPTATATVRPTSTPSNCSITMTLDPGHLNFEDDRDSLPLVIGIEGCDWVVEFELTPTESWIEPEPNTGTIQPDGEVLIVVKIQRSQLDAGANSGQIVVDSIIGTRAVQVSAEGS